jgi:ribonuclease R
MTTKKTGGRSRAGSAGKAGGGKAASSSGGSKRGSAGKTAGAAGGAGSRNANAGQGRLGAKSATAGPGRAGGKAARATAGRPAGKAAGAAAAGSSKSGASRSSGRKLPPWMPEHAAPSTRAGQPSRNGGAQARKRTPEGPGATSVRQAGFDPYAEREQRRYENPIPSREAIMAYMADQARLMTAQEIAEGLELTAPDRFEALGKRLSAMLRDGQLLMNRRGGYGIADKLNLVPGIVLGKEDGFGFLRPDAGGDDIFLPPVQMRRVLHGDRAMVSITGMDRQGRQEGVIVEVLQRRASRLVGVYSESGGVGIVDPDDSRIHMDVVIPPDERGEARSGQLVVCEITQPPAGHRPPMGRILTVLGDRLTPTLVIEAAIHNHGLPHEWPADALREAEEVSLEVTDAEREGRVDLRELPLVTIDGEDAKDFDDAVWCEPKGDGFRLIVAIADVSHYVRPGSPLDAEAQNRATSVYFPGYVVPMLPETLSNGICSLRPKVERLCFACDMEVNGDGEVVRSKFYPAVMRSHARLTYTQVWRAVGEKEPEAQAELGEVLGPVKRLFQLYRLFSRRRAERGALDFESTETSFRLGPTGEVMSLGAYERNDAHKLIEECMIAANVEAAKYLLRRRIPAPYRVHDRPPERKYIDLVEFLAEFGLGLPPYEKVTPLDYAALLKKVRKRADATLLESVLLRSMSLAVYQPANIGHFGLALGAYAHFTSPIRRYADLLVHRAIRHALAGGKASDYEYAAHDIVSLAAHCSDNSRRAEEAEREVDERYRCAWMEQHVGSEFEGTISGVTSFGLFVELDESRVSGLVHVTQLPNDYYHFDPLRKVLTGERRRMAFQLGDRVRVLVLRASLEERKIDFRLVVDDDEAASRGRAAPGRGRKPKVRGRR